MPDQPSGASIPQIAAKELIQSAQNAVDFLRACEWNDRISETDASDIAQRLEDAIVASEPRQAPAQEPSELDDLVSDYKRIEDSQGEHRIKDLVWLVNELIYEREHRGEPHQAPAGWQPSDRIFCDGCGTVEPLVIARMEADARNDHPATDLLCGTCLLIVATIHHAPPAPSLPEGQ